MTGVRKLLNYKNQMIIEHENLEFERKLDQDNKQAILKRFEIELMLKRMDAIDRPSNQLPIKKYGAKVQQKKEDSSDSEIEVDTTPDGTVMKKPDETP